MAGEDAVLAEFQTITAIESIDQCVAVLDSCNWDLANAVQRVFSSPSTNEAIGQFEPISIDDSPALASGDASPYISFNIHTPNGRVTEVMTRGSSVEDLKQRLFSNGHIKMRNFSLAGWRTSLPVTDSTKFQDLHIDSDSSVDLIAILPDDVPDDASTAVNFVISNLDTGGEMCLALERHESQGQLKRLVNSLTGIAIDKQEWSSELQTAEPVSQLKSTKLTVRSKRSSRPLSFTAFNASLNNQGSTSRTNGANEADSTGGAMSPVLARQPSPESAHSPLESDDETYYDGTSDDQMMFSEHSRPNPLIPAGVEDEVEAALAFSRNFAQMYGLEHPTFFLGRLRAALNEALGVKAGKRKLLALYIHHNQSIFTNVFCSQVLCSRSVMDYLAQNVVLWGWDVTIERERFLEVVGPVLGYQVTNLVNTSQGGAELPDRLPLVVLVGGSSSSPQIVSWICGSVGVDEVMSKLVSAVDIFRNSLASHVESERLANEARSMRNEQDIAFQMSLAADQEKALERERQEAGERAARLAAEELATASQRARDELRQAVEARLPPEPELDCGLPVNQFRIRLPAGGSMERRFLSQHPLQSLLDYVCVKGFDTSREYRLVQTFPRRCLNELDPTRSLADYKLCAKESLVLERKD